MSFDRKVHVVDALVQACVYCCSRKSCWPLRLMQQPGVRDLEHTWHKDVRSTQHCLSSSPADLDLSPCKIS